MRPGDGPRFDASKSELYMQRFGLLSLQWPISPVSPSARLEEFRARYTDDQLRAAFQKFARVLVRHAKDLDDQLQQAETWRVELSAEQVSRTVVTVLIDSPQTKQ